MSLRISAIICTYNPRHDLLRRVLAALDRQTLSGEQWELVIVDNNTNPPLRQEDWNDGGKRAMRIVREPRQGKVFAYDAAVRAASADLIVMIDDDNFLDADYLQQAVAIADAHPEIGAFGGITRGVYEPGWIARWKKPLMGSLGVRDFGSEAIVSDKDEWGPHEPIGAGMVLRRTVGLKYCELLETLPGAKNLDRCGDGGLLSGGDSLLARSAYRVGLKCSYQPSLKLDHFIKAPRLTVQYLTKIMIGHGRSVVILDRALGKKVKPLTRIETLIRLPYRFATQGYTGLANWCFDLGYLIESRKEAGK